MLKIINNAVCRGVAGKMVSVKGVVIHNTYDNHSAEWHMNRLANMTTRQLEAGYAHYFIDENTIVRTENTYNAVWHTANYEGNYNYIGYEVKGDNNTNTKDFLQAEQNAFWQAAADLRFYKLPVNRNTVRLHHEFSATECPKRSLIQHCSYNSRYAVPQSVTNQLKDYFIKEIKKYYENPNLKPDSNNQEVKPVAKKVVYQTTPGKYRALKTDNLYLEKELKTKSAWKIEEGQEWYLEDIVVIGKYSRAKIRLNNDIRYCTMRDDYWKLISKTEAKKIK